MPRFGNRSKSNLDSCDNSLVEIAYSAIRIIDFIVLKGHRGRVEQNNLYDDGLTTFRYPNSFHNLIPSYAFDLAPWPIDWHDHNRFYALAGIIIGIGHEKEIPIRWGGDWDRDFTYTDQQFDDLGHFERILE